MAFIAVTELSGTINERKLSGLMPILEAQDDGKSGWMPLHNL